MRFERNSCIRKFRHPDYFSALRHAATLSEEDSLVIYPCVFCVGLHVGHVRPNTAKRVRRALRKVFGPDAA